MRFKRPSNDIENVITSKNLADVKFKTGNLYESIVIISKRASQINVTIKEELHNRLEEFATHTDNLEEIHENKEQIELSKSFEKLPNASLIAFSEFMTDKVYFRQNEVDLFE